ncbi:NAD(P)-binding protein [Tilletiaria anomala UBC 951]|uniref:NAD(P)-binding protein n=1 Tax=Tilletiaria anomala (strain ATCC 24038 / CBS 436.72 / UBC 951) TaxID=1037660 RepID=A0A066WE30_TILAU|nr:NAD(P)-binding protein [Tilletiaria anomala UBC 951]KDN52016.1 NAD(P)-binding protein [Tilletiaria anomala UBC 951]
MSSPKTLFLVGTGFIGGSILTALLQERKDLEVSALTRNDGQAAKLKELGVQPVKGSLDDTETIKAQAAKSDIIIHVATADHISSAKAIAEGIRSRTNKSRKTIYIHTSGTGVLVDDSNGKYAADPATYTFYDTRPAEIDSRLKDSAPHRDVDLTLKQLLANEEAEREFNARAAIITPPLIYGLGTGPFNKQSIQVPAHIRAAVKAGKAFVVGGGKGIWNAIHIQDLVSAYLLLLSHLEQSPPGSPGGPYIYAETQLFSWGDLAQVVARRLHAVGKLSSKKMHTATDDELNKFFFGVDVSYSVLACNSISKAEKLPALGWKPNPSLPSLLESVEKQEVDELLKREFA